MILGIEEENIKRKRYHITKSVFTVAECNLIIQMGNTYKLESIQNLVQVYNLNTISFEQKSHWIYDRICNTIINANNEIFHFDLIGVEQRLQMISLKDKDIYKWHSDNTLDENDVRKLTAVVQLSSPKTYEDGDLEIWDSGVVKIPNDIGSVCVFPGYNLTRIIPVSSGFKFCLILYISGPRFR